MMSVRVIPHNPFVTAAIILQVHNFMHNGCHGEVMTFIYWLKLIKGSPAIGFPGGWDCDTGRVSALDADFRESF